MASVTTKTWHGQIPLVWAYNPYFKPAIRAAIAPARGPPLWDGCDAQVDDAVHIEPDWDLAAQPTPDYEVDHRINWWQAQPAILNRCGVNLRPAHAVHRRSRS